MENFRNYFQEGTVGSLSGWILPNGTAVKVPLHKHDEYIKDNPEKFDMTEDEVIDIEESPTGLAINSGGIRFSIIGHSSDISGKLSYIKHNIERLHDIIKSTGRADHVYLYVPGMKVKRVSLDDFFFGEF